MKVDESHLIFSSLHILDVSPGVWAFNNILHNVMLNVLLTSVGNLRMLLFGHCYNSLGKQGNN